MNNINKTLLAGALIVFGQIQSDELSLIKSSHAFTSVDSVTEPTREDLPNYNMAVDDLSNKINYLAIPNGDYTVPSELISELEEVGREQGFEVDAQYDMYTWTEDNMWLARDGQIIYRPSHSISNKLRFERFVQGADMSGLSTLEGHHFVDSMNGKDSVNSQGLTPDLLDKANKFAEYKGAELREMFSIIDGGNMLVGKRSDNSHYAIVGRDALLQTAIKYLEFDEERARAKQQEMQSDGKFTLGVFKEFFPFFNNYLIGYDTEIDRLIAIEAGIQSITQQSNLAAQREATNLLRAKAKIATIKWSFEDQNQLKDSLVISDELYEAVRSRIDNVLDEEQKLLFYVQEGKAREQTEETLEQDIRDFIKESYAILQLADKYHNRDSHGFDLNRLERRIQSGSVVRDTELEQHLSGMLTAGHYIRRNLPEAELHYQAYRFRVMLDLVEEEMAKELGLDPSNLVLVAQPAFHIDMHMRPLEDGKVLINSYALSKANIDEILANYGHALTTEEHAEFKMAQEDLDRKTSDYSVVYKKIKEQLIEAGLEPIDIMGDFTLGKNKHVNWMNGIMGHGKDKFYVTNASSDQRLNTLFERNLQKHIKDIKVYFVGNEARENDDDGRNQAEYLLAGQGGLECVTVHHE